MLTNLRLDAVRRGQGRGAQEAHRADQGRHREDRSEGRRRPALAASQAASCCASQGKTIEAIQTLEKARQLAEQRSRHLDSQRGRLERWEVNQLLARAYIETNQMGQAKQLLTGLVNKFPRYDPARMMLTQILIKDGSYEGARSTSSTSSGRTRTTPTCRSG